MNERDFCNWQEVEEVFDRLEVVLDNECNIPKGIKRDSGDDLPSCLG